MIPVFLAAQRAIVHPDRRHGAYAVDGRFRLSHFMMGKSPVLFELASCDASGMLILLFALNSTSIVRQDRYHTPQEPSIFEHYAYRPTAFHILLAIAAYV